MLLLRVTDDRGAVAQYLALTFPYRIGRSSAADLRIESPGVWDAHASIALGGTGKFIVAPEGASLLLLNGETTSGAPLRAGDELTLGGVRIAITLAPARQARLWIAETVVWTLLGAVCVAQFAVIFLAG